jgi:hypothetical protein
MLALTSGAARTAESIAANAGNTLKNLAAAVFVMTVSATNRVESNCNAPPPRAESRTPTPEPRSRTMSDRYHSVWQDEFSELWIVDRCDEHDNSNTVQAFEKRHNAEAFAKELSAKTGLPIRPTHWQEGGNHDFHIFVEAMCDEAVGDFGIGNNADRIRWGVVNDPVVRSVIMRSMQAGFTTRQALQSLAAVMIDQNRILAAELAKAASIAKASRSRPPQPIVINGVTYTPITEEPKP